MGNSCEGRSNLLIKNWTKVSAQRYRNVITDELIDQYLAQYQNEEQMAVGARSLNKRATLNHPNIIKLIYFNDSNGRSNCKNRTYAHRVFIEHYEANLAQIMQASDQKERGQCLCCSIINGLVFLSQKYGSFLVKEEMIFICARSCWKRDNNQTAKVWMNSELKYSEPEMACSEQEMCQKIAVIFRRIFEHKLCSNSQILQLGRLAHLQQQLDCVFQSHHYSPDKPRKKILSTLTSASQPQLPSLVNVYRSGEASLHLIDRSTSAYPKEAMGSKKETPLQQYNVPEAANFYKKNMVFPVSPQGETRPLQKGFSHQNLSYRPQSSQLKVNFAFVASPQNNRSYQSSRGQLPISPKFGRPLQPYFPTASEFKVAVEQKIPSVTQASEEKLGEPPKIVEQDIESIKEEQLLKELQEIGHSEQSRKNSRVSLQDVQKTSKEEPCVKDAVEQAKHIVESPIAKKTVNKVENCAVIPIQQIQQKVQMIEEAVEPSNEEHHFCPLQQESSVERISFRDKPEPLYYSRKEQIGVDRRYKGGQFDEDIGQFGRKNRQTYDNLDSNYNRYLQRFNMVVVQPKKTAITKTYSYKEKLQSSQHQPKPNDYKDKLHLTDCFSNYPKHGHTQLFTGQLRLSEQQNSAGRQLQAMLGKKAKQVGRGELQSMSGMSQSSGQSDKKPPIIQRIDTTEKQIRENRRKLQKMQLQKDLQQEKEIIKREMESLLKNNLMTDESHRIKEKVKYKKATFAQLKAEASKILDDLNF